MKIKDGAIKPRMVIHCPKEEDAIELARKLIASSNTMARYWNHYRDETCFYILPNMDVNYGKEQYYRANGHEINEFSDLIEPDDLPTNSDTDSPMSAVEVLEWLSNHYNDYNGKLFTGVFGADYTFYELLIEKKLSPMEIVQKITAYEAKKKAPKPIETEWDDICRIIQIESNGVKRCVHEEDITGRPELVDTTVSELVESILKKYTLEHEGKYFAVIENVCRAKEYES